MDRTFHKEFGALSRSLFDSPDFYNMKLEKQRTEDAEAEEEAQGENSINSAHTNFLSKFKDSYNINQSLNSQTKQDESDKTPKNQFQQRKSTISKTSIKKDQSKDLTTLNVSSKNLKPTPQDLHKSLGKLSESIPKGIDWSFKQMADQHWSVHKDESKDNTAKQRGNLNMSLNYHFKPNLTSAHHLFDPRKPETTAIGLAKKMNLKNMTTNSSHSNSMIISNSSKNFISSRSCTKKLVLG